MPVSFSPVRKAKLKKALLAGKSVRQAMRDAGYSPATASHSTCESVVKLCIKEIEEEIKAQITVEYVLREMERLKKLAENNDDISSAIRANELLGKYLAMFTDKHQVTDDGKFLSDKDLEDANRVNRLEYIQPSPS